MNRKELEETAQKFHDLASVVTGIPLDRLEAICAAEREQRLVELPCRIGETLMLEGDGGPFGTHGMMPYKLGGISFEVFGDWGGLTNHKSATLDEIREAAEAKEITK